MNIVALVGHSFISRLESDGCGFSVDFSFISDLIRVSCLGRCGGKIRHFFFPLISTDLISIHSHVILLQIRGNDLDACGPLVPSDSIVQELIVFADWLIDMYDIR